MQKYLILLNGINLNFNSLSLEEAKAKLAQMKTEYIGTKTFLEIAEVGFKTDLEIALNVAKEVSSSEDDVVEQIAQFGFLISSFVLNLKEGRAKIGQGGREEVRVYFEVIGRYLNLLLTQYSDDSLFSFLESRRHWAGEKEVQNPEKEIVSLLLEILGNTIKFDKTGMSVKPILKLLGLKKYW